MNEQPTTLAIIIGDDSLTIVNADNRRQVYVHLSKAQARILMALRTHDFRRRALLAVALDVGHTRTDRRAAGERITPSKRASLSRSIRRLTQHGFVRKTQDGYLQSTERGEAIIDLLQDDVTFKGDSLRLMARQLGVTRDRFRRLTASVAPSHVVNVPQTAGELAE